MLNTLFKYLNLSNEFDLILPNLYIGNYNSSKNLNFLKEHDIKIIINCTKNLNFIESFKGEKIRIPIDDNRIFKNNDILKYLNVLDIIHKNRLEKNNILVHCHMGSQRSATIILLYLTKKLDYSYDEGLNLLKLKRTICFYPINNFNHIFCDDTNSLTFS